MIDGNALHHLSVTVPQYMRDGWVGRLPPNLGAAVSDRLDGDWNARLLGMRMAYLFEQITVPQTRIPNYFRNVRNYYR